jgi:arylsulfatase A-like enzyme
MGTLPLGLARTITLPFGTSEVGPFDRWPNGLGFDYFYGFQRGDTSQFEPILYENHNRVPRSTGPNYHLSPDTIAVPERQ